MAPRARLPQGGHTRMRRVTLPLGWTRWRPRRLDQCRCDTQRGSRTARPVQMRHTARPPLRARPPRAMRRVAPPLRLQSGGISIRRMVRLLRVRRRARLSWKVSPPRSRGRVIVNSPSTSETTLTRITPTFRARRPLWTRRRRRKRERRPSCWMLAGRLTPRRMGPVRTPRSLAACSGCTPAAQITLAGRSKQPGTWTSGAG
mmetsp:Transcript_23892/g.63055  ORF Transcript_23892/g.63055 Transcript_23892/m.63055 type:complete len:202 (+) Transcript_23892:69-674(+)